MDVSEMLDASVQDKIRKKIEKSIPDAKERRAALELLAYAVENADNEQSNAWWLRESKHGLKLFAGRLQVCGLSKGKVSLAVLGPLSPETYAALDADADDSEVWRAIPEGLFLTFPVSKANVALELLKDPIDKFVDEAIGRVKRKVSLSDHLPEAVAYVADAVGRELPQPSESDEDDEVDSDDDEVLEDETDSREPKVRGRSPIFEHSQRSIASLISDVKDQMIALPNLQRPFVWEDTKVRELLDSLFVGFPVGTLVLWHTSDGKEAHAVGHAPKNLKSTVLIIDGQQRLTSLYAVITGHDVIDKDGTKRKITIAFRPRDGKFEVADAANRNDPEFIPNVTELWDPNRTPSQIRRDLIKTLESKGRQIDDAYEEAVDQNLARAKQIADYRFPIVDIRKTSTSAEASEQDVAEIFVRINNQGTRLGQADFVLTLLSVFHPNLREQIEDQAVDLSKDSVVRLDTQQLLRVTCAVGFGRARMSAIYRLLRGADPTGESTIAAREKRLALLEEAAAECVHPSTWRDYMLRVVHAGLVSPSLVASNAAVVNAYAIYALGKRVKVPKQRLDELISRWVFAAQLTARYSSSAETKFEEDLARLRNANSADAFIDAVDGALADEITEDYWSKVITSLQTQRGRAPTAVAFRAAQIVLGSRALLSDQSMRNLLAPTGKNTRSAGEVHHLFPKKWLMSHGVTDRRRINQVANLADVGWWENSVIGEKSPAQYVPKLRTQLKIDDDRWGRMCAEHALPSGWEQMDYDTFLKERRPRMADIIRVAYRTLGGEADAAPLAPPWFLPGAELVWKRIVETERALRALIRDIYVKKFGAKAAQRIEDAVPAAERPALTRLLRKRAPGADPLSVVDYLYLGQLPALLFSNDAWPDAQKRMKAGANGKQQIETAVQQIAAVRNEIAHVREVSTAQLQKTSVACNDLIEMIGT